MSIPDFNQAEIFGYTFKQRQLNIIVSVLHPEVTRLFISAYTQYGKTRAVAVGVLLDIINSQNKKYAFIAPTIKQTNIIRNYVAEIISNTPSLCALVDDPYHRGPERLKREMSKERVTFKNGCEILTLSAHGEEGGKDPGAQLMGFGADVIILDEACLILDEIYRKRIKRMLTSNPNAKLIMLVNPWKTNHFAYRAWNSPRFKKIHIPWQQGVAEGRVTREFIEEVREELTPLEFLVLYESEFPTDVEDALVRWSWIEAAQNRQIEWRTQPRLIHGVDVAERGVDRTILTDAYTDGVHYQVLRQTWIREQETVPCAKKIASLINPSEPIQVDSIGVGAGVYSYLKEQGYKVISVRVSEKPTTPEAQRRFVNQKAQRWWMLRELFEHGRISIPRDYKLAGQLQAMRYEIRNGKIHIIDPEGKSPDEADSLMLMLQDGGVRKPKVGNAY